MINQSTSIELTNSNIRQLSGGRLYVFEVMKTGKWKTISEIQTEITNHWGVYFTEPCISARVRDLRKPEFGGYIVNRKSRNGRLYEYQLQQCS